MHKYIHPGCVSKALVVEDEQINQKICCFLLKNLNCQIDVAATGAQALSFARKTSYDVMLMDLGLPDMDGRDLLKKMRAKLKITTPVIMLTAHGADFEQDCFDAGANDFFVKPANLRVLQATIEKWLLIKQ
jgi:DNA-binding response OmpR family regulator